MPEILCQNCGNTALPNDRFCRKCGSSLSTDIVAEDPIKSDEPISSGVEIADISDIKTNYALMLKEIRSWSLWLLGLGVLHIILSGFLNASWGILLIIVGLASFYYRTSSIFIIYVVTLAWAAVSNLKSLESGWIFFSLVQLFIAFRVFQQYRRFRETESKFINLDPDNTNNSSMTKERAAHSFPWIGSFLGCSSMIGLGILLVLTLILASANGWKSVVPNYYVFIEGMVANIAVLGFAVSLASLLSKYRPNVPAIIGSIAGGLIMAFYLVF
jgi:hypothetical protein